MKSQPFIDCVKAKMKSCNWSCLDLSDACGASHTTAWRWLNGTAPIKLADAISVARTLQFSDEEWLSLYNSPELASPQGEQMGEYANA